MTIDSPKKALPLPFVLTWGFGMIFWNLFEKFHPFHPPVFTPLFLILDNILPSLVTLAIILYCFTDPSNRKLTQTLLLVFALWDMAGSILNTMDLWNLSDPQVLAVLKSWSFTQSLLKIYLQNIGNWIFDLLVGLSFLKKKPLGLEYPSGNPFQDVFMQFTGVLWVLDSVYQFGLHLMVLAYKMMKYF